MVGISAKLAFHQCSPCMLGGPGKLKALFFQRGDSATCINYRGTTPWGAPPQKWGLPKLYFPHFMLLFLKWFAIFKYLNSNKEFFGPPLNSPVSSPATRSMGISLPEWNANALDANALHYNSLNLQDWCQTETTWPPPPMEYNIMNLSNVQEATKRQFGGWNGSGWVMVTQDRCKQFTPKI